jgi:hypothetical protein
MAGDLLLCTRHVVTPIAKQEGTYMPVLFTLLSSHCLSLPLSLTHEERACAQSNTDNLTHPNPFCSYPAESVTMRATPMLVWPVTLLLPGHPLNSGLVTPLTPGLVTPPTSGLVTADPGPGDLLTSGLVTLLAWVISPYSPTPAAFGWTPLCPSVGCCAAHALCVFCCSMLSLLLMLDSISSLAAARLRMSYSSTEGRDS